MGGFAPVGASVGAHVTRDLRTVLGAVVGGKHGVGSAVASVDGANDAVGTYDAIGLCDGAYDIEAVGAYDGAYDTVAVGAYVREGEAGGKTGAGEGMKTGGACAGSRGLAADALGTTGFGSLARSRPRRGVSCGYSVGGSTEDAARSASPNPASAKLSEAA